MDFYINLIIAIAIIVSMYGGIWIGRRYPKQSQNAIIDRLVIACKLAVAVLCEPDIQADDRPFLGHITPQYALQECKAILAELGESESIGP